MICFRPNSSKWRTCWLAIVCLVWEDRKEASRSLLDPVCFLGLMLDARPLEKTLFVVWFSSSFLYHAMEKILTLQNRSPDRQAMEPEWPRLLAGLTKCGWWRDLPLANWITTYSCLSLVCGFTSGRTFYQFRIRFQLPNTRKEIN